MTTPLPVLYDGWALVHQPNSPQALHLLHLLYHLPPQVQAWVALPGQAPQWLPKEVQPLVRVLPDTPGAALLWEQYLLPKMRRQVGAALLHLIAFHPPLLDAAHCLVSPAAYEQPVRRSSFSERLRQALSAGAMTGLGGVLWPQDLPEPSLKTALFRLPPLMAPPSLADEAPSPPLLAGFPEAYILYHGSDDEVSLRRVLDAWSWAAASLGQDYPLLLVGMEEAGRAALPRMLAQSDLGDTVRIAPRLKPQALPWLYRRAAALFHPLPLPPWGDVVRLALACGLAVVAVEEPVTQATVGPAAYLSPLDDWRHLAAALITVIVEDEVAQYLIQAGRRRATAWSGAEFGLMLLEAYQAFVGQ